MSGEINAKLHYPSTSNSLAEVSEHELFSFKFNGKPYVAMLALKKGESPYSESRVVLIGKDGVITVSLSTARVYGEFLGYLSTEDSVQLFGSQDPKWHPPAIEEETYISPFTPPTNARNFHEIPIGIPFRFTWDYIGHTEDAQQYGIKLRSSYDPNRVVYLRHAADPLYKGDKYGHWTMSERNNQPDATRRFIRYEPSIPECLIKHPSRHDGVWEGII